MDSQNGSLSGKHVLIVDDDIELALMYQELLETHDCRASTAANGAEALKLLKTTAVDAIICDLSMPELAGDLFYAEVGRARPQLLKRFVFVTANVGNPIYDSFLKTVKAPVLAKPVPLRLLLEQLQAVFRAGH